MEYFSAKLCGISVYSMIESWLLFGKIFWGVLPMKTLSVLKSILWKCGNLCVPAVFLLFMGAVFLNCSQKATPLSAEPVTLCSQNPDNPDCVNDGGSPGVVPINSLFTLNPGETAILASFGVVDPVGTALSNDFDGDAITNDKESVSNLWVAEYPVIDTSIAPPVTMEIQILKDKTGQANTIVNNIASSDFESRRNTGSEKFHQKELNRKTVQYTKTVQHADSDKWSVNLGLFSFGGGKDNSSAETKDVFEVKPFRNNIDRTASSVRSNSALNNARQYRTEKSSKVDETSTVEPNAGRVRAALYIKNHSVNMPVRLSNILCSLLFESGEGELIPIQSFKLRNADYSEFVVEVYGASEFGPYVIDLPGLNTAEVENAIAKGYTPKIFIVDYTMTHVADSNYKAALGSTFSGDNLKIIEENSKGRTALLKLIGPYMREMFRVAAFSVDTDTNPDGCGIAGPATTVTAGITMERLLKRVACSGMNIQFDHYIFDYTGTILEGTNPLVYTYSVKSVGAVANNFPCHAHVDGNDINGQPVTACLVRLADLSSNDLDQTGMWAFFDSGKYFDHRRYVTDGAGNMVTFDGTIPMMEGVHSTVWAGDFYDLTYFSMSDIIIREQEFGSNPFETGEVFAMNSRWSHEELGLNPWYPNVKSVYLGQAGLGERFQVEVTLDNTWKLNPDFGTSYVYDSHLSYRNFLYNPADDVSTLYDIGEAFDFQVSFGLGGAPGDWYNLLRAAGSPSPDDNTVADGISDCGQSWSFLQQKYTVCIQVPASMPGVGADAVVHIFLRPSPNNAYRETVWPKTFSTVNRFEATLMKSSLIGESFIETVLDGGELATGVVEDGTVIVVGSRPYRIADVSYFDRVFMINLKSQAGVVFSAGDTVTFGAFNGTLKSAVTTTSTVLLVTPDTLTDTLAEGTLLDGQTATVGTLNTPVSVGSVYLKKDVYSINLQTPLAEDHLSGESISINAGLPAPQVEYQQSNNFITDWNADPANAATANTPESSTMLYGAAPAGCLYGLDNLRLVSPGCQGYAADALSANWAGAGAFENNWSDSAFYQGWVANMVSPSATSLNGETMRTMPVPENKTLVSGDMYRTFGVSWGSKTLVVAAEHNGTDYDIVGVIVDENGAPVGSKFLIGNKFQGAVGNEQIYPYAAVHGDRALVTWMSGATGDIHGKFIDLNNPAAGTEEVISTTSPGANQVAPRVVVTDAGKALVVWHSNEGAQGYNVRGRTYDIVTGLPVAGAFGSDTGDFLLSTFQTNSQFAPYPATFGAGNSKAFVVWHSLISTNYNIRGRFIDIDNETWLSAELVVSTSNGSQQYYPRVAVSGDTALVVWESAHTGVWNAMGVFYDLTTLAATSTDFQVGVITTGNGILPKVSASGSYGLVCWKDSIEAAYDARCRVADMVNHALLGGDIPVTTKTTLEQAVVDSVIVGDKGYVVWRSEEAGGWVYRGQVIDLATQTLDSVQDFIVSDQLYPAGTQVLDGANIYPNPNLPVMINNGTGVLAIWGTNTGLYSQKLVPGSVFPLPHGLNNFFVSPLIERDYSIRSWLVY